MPVIGILHGNSPGASADNLAAFRQSLNDTGYVEHRNVGIEYRWAEGQCDRLPALAADLVRRQVNFVANSTAATLAAKAATSTIPIVFGICSNPVKNGLVASLARPGGNLTGVTTLTEEVGPKRLEAAARIGCHGDQHGGAPQP